MLLNYPRKNLPVRKRNGIEFHFFICFPPSCSFCSSHLILELEMTSHGFGADHPDDDDDEDDNYSEDEENGKHHRQSGSGGGHSRIMEEEYDIVGFERYKRQREKEK